MRKIGRKLKRVLSLILACFMALSSPVDYLGMGTVRAEGLEHPDFVINDTVTTNNSYNAEYGQIIHVKSPGKPFGFRLDGAENPIVLHDDGSGEAFEGDVELSTNTSSEFTPGTYHIMFVYLDEEGSLVVAEEDQINATLVIDKATISQPSNLTLEKNSSDQVIASWDVPTVSVRGNALLADIISGYTVNVYRNGVKVGEPISVLSNSTDLTSVINDTYGKWTFGVVANASDNERYNDSDEIVVSSEYVVEDHQGPTITNFKGTTTVDGVSALGATLADSESGIKAYAFTTSATAPAPGDSQWIDIVSVGSANASIAYVPQESGTYYCHAIDVDGLVSSTDSTCMVTILSLYNYYKENVWQKNSGSEYLNPIVEGQSYTLPGQAGERKGYNFEGWYSDSEMTVSGPSTFTANGLDAAAYAKWAAGSITVDISASSTSAVYGEDITLTATANYSLSDGSIINYQWQKKNAHSAEYVDIQGEESNTLVLTQVSDSGEYRCRAYIVDADGNEIEQFSTSESIVIDKAFLDIDIDRQEIAYGDEVPELTYTLSGFKKGETLESLIADGKVTGGLSTDYKQNDDVGTGSYEIKYDSFNIENYEIRGLNGVLVVNRKTLTDSDIVVTLNNGNTYVYTGANVEPAVVVKIAGMESAVDSDEISIEYSNNKNVTTEAVVKVTFIKNYTGSKTVNFEIEKSDRTKPVVSISSEWIYGNAHTAASVDVVEDSTIPRYRYVGTKLSGESYDSYTEPKDAGNYTVTAEIAATGNYNTVYSDPVSFTIKPKKITITAKSKNYLFDGNSHQLPEYTPAMESMGLVGADRFQSIKVEGSIKFPGEEVDNVVTVVWGEGVNQNNYDLELVDGKLTMSGATLPVPGNYRWDSDLAGQATWTSLYRENLDIKYIVKLYRVGTGPDGSDELIKTEEVKKEPGQEDVPNSVDFSEDIKAQKAKYYFTIQALVDGGLYKDYYSDGRVSDKSSEILSFNMEVDYDATSIESISIDGVQHTKGEQLMVVAGQRMKVTANTKKGFVIDGDVAAWTTADINGDNARYCYYEDANAKETYLKLGSYNSGFNYDGVIKIYAGAVDNAPEISNFSADNTADFAKAQINIDAFDLGGVTAYKLYEVGKEEQTPWVKVTPENENYSVNIKVGKEGKYRLVVTDLPVNGDGTVTDTGDGHIVYAENTIEINKIIFKCGISGDSQPDKTIYVVNDSHFVLPQNTYVRTGYGFKEWSSKDGSTHTDKDSYVVEGDDILTAVWTQANLTYKINYYEMDTAGDYQKIGEGKTFNCAYNTIVRYNNPEIQSSTKGLRLADEDFIKSKNGGVSELTITEANMEFDLYYVRPQYTLKYVYNHPTTGLEVVYDESIVYYGQTFSEPAGFPSMPGFTFSSKWIYDLTGDKPATMPAGNLTASVTCSADKGSYVINYYYQNLPDTINGISNIYTLEKSETMLSFQGTKISYDLDVDAPEKPGFSAYAVIVTTSAAGGADKPGLAASNTAEGYVDIGAQLNINVYYKRNKHDITLNVDLKEAVDNPQLTNQWKNVPYGWTFTDDELDKYATFAGESKKDTDYVDGDGFLKNIVSILVGGSRVEHYLGNHENWSTGAERPVTMPDGDVTVTREYILTSEAKVLVEVFLEDATGNYNSAGEMAYYGPAGGVAALYDSTNPATTAMAADASIKIDYSTFGELLDNFNAYTYKSIDGELLKATVNDTNNGETPTKLAIYFERKVSNLTITYYYRKSDGSDAKKIATVTKSGKWGQSYDANLLAAFYTAASTNGDDYVTEKDTYNAAIMYEAGNIDGVSYKDYDFCANKYVVSSSARTWVSANGPTEGGWNYPGETIRKVESIPETKTGSCVLEGNRKYYFGKYYSRNNAGIGEYNNSNTITVYYTEIDPERTYFVNYGFHTNNLKGNPDAATVVAKSTFVPVKVKLSGDNLNNDGSLSGTGFSDKEFYVRLANKSDLVVCTPADKAGYERYPGAAQMSENKEYTYDSQGAPQAGYYRVSVGGTNYYAKDEGGNSYIYISQPNNPFYVGNYTTNVDSGVSSSSTDPLKKAIYNLLWKDILVKLKTPSDGSTYVDYSSTDVNYDAITIEGNGCYIREFTPNRGYDRNIYTFTYLGSHNVYYSVGENRYFIPYVHGSTAKLGYEKDGVSKVDSHFQDRNGYEIKWYSKKADGTLVELAPDARVTVNSELHYYGRYEKSIIKGKLYEHYELPCDIQVGEDDVRYITASNLSSVQAAFTAKGLNLVESNSTETIKYKDENGDEQSIIDSPVKTYTCSCHNAVLFRVHDKVMTSFSEVDVKKEKAAIEAGADFAGFEFDAGNPNNSIISYCQYNPVNFDLYYSRYRYELAKDYNYKHNNNVSVLEYVFGHTIELEKPSMTGYDFDGWKVYEGSVLNKDDDENITNSLVYNSTVGDGVDGSLSFEMPTKALYAQAQWKNSNYKHPVTYYFQNNDKTYPTDLVNSLIKVAKAQYAGESLPSGYTTVSNSFYKQVAFGSDGYDSYEVYENGILIGGFEKSTVGGKSGIAFYSCDEREDNSVHFYADTTNAIGVLVECSMTSATVYSVSDFEMTLSGSPYSFVQATYKLETQSDVLGSAGTFTADPDMELNYYYGLELVETLDLVGVATDGESAPMTFVGNGDHSYGENITISASYSSDSFDFVGWYKGDVLDGEGKLISSKLTAENKISDTATTIYRMRGSSELVAVVSPKGFPLNADVSIDGSKGTDLIEGVIKVGKEVDYGTSLVLKPSIKYYNDDPAVPLTPDHSIVIGRVVWTRVKLDSMGNPIGTKETVQDSEAMNLVVPNDMNSGSYMYECTITLKRTDNERERTLAPADFKLKVNTLDVAAIATPYVGVYDGEYHNITVKAPAGATVYYSTDTVLTEENYSTAGKLYSSDPGQYPGIKDVAVDGDETPIAQTVYYYIKNPNSNYVDKSGSSTVTITPAKLNIKPSLSAKFGKVYDGSKKIQGRGVEGSDYERLSEIAGNGYYTITGWVGSDGDNVETFLLYFDAETNSRHVEDVTHLTMTNMHIEMKESMMPTHNYSFKVNDSISPIIIGAEIKPFNLEIEWKEDPTFNGDDQHPPVVITSSNLPKLDGASEPEMNISKLKVSGLQTNVGTNYTAYVDIDSTGEDKSIEDSFRTADYTISGDKTKKIYSVKQRKLIITPIDHSFVYNGYTHSRSGRYMNMVNTYFTVTTDATDGKPALDEDYVFDCATYYTAGSAVNNYQVTANPSSFKVYQVSTNELGESIYKDVTANFEIDFSNSGTYSITPCEVYIDGIVAKDKPYDSNTQCEIDDTKSDISVKRVGTSLTSHDTLGVDKTKIVLTFDSAVIGSHNVTIAYPDADSVLTGAAKRNYRLVTDAEAANPVPYASQNKSSAAITGKVIKVEFSDESITYGDTPVTLTPSYTLIGDDTVAPADLSISYMVKRIADADGSSVTETAIAPAVTNPAGTYEVIPTIGNANIGNYSFETGDHPTLVIGRRTVTLTGAGTVEKVYDANTTATISDDNYTVAGVVNGDTVKLDVTKGQYTAEYNSKDVATANTVTVTGAKLASDANNNYKLASDTFSITNGVNSAKVAIKERELTVTAKNKETVYGKAAPAFTVEYSGFATGEDTDVLTGTLDFECAYDISDSANRDSGEYDIEPKGLTAANYDVVFVKGKLDVKKAKLKINVDPHTGDGVYEFYFGTQTFKTYKGSSGVYSISTGSLEYSENLDVIDPSWKDSITFNYKNATPADLTDEAMNTAPEGNYKVYANVSALNTKGIRNYEMEAGDPADVRIVKSGIKVEGISVKDKTYDGTSNAEIDWANSAMKFELFEGPVENGIQKAGYFTLNQLKDIIGYTGSDNSKILQIIATFTDGSGNADADAATGKDVQLVVSAGDELAKRYILADYNNSTTASIDKKPITITVGDQTAKYGEKTKAQVESAYSLNYSGTGEYNGFVNAAEKEALLLTADQWDIETSYVNNANVGSYDLTIVDKAASVKNAANIDSTLKNYAITLVKGTLTVAKNKLAAPTVTWDTDTTKLGTVNWTTVAGIGDVVVSDYTLVLKRGDVVVETVSGIAATQNSYDFKTKLKEEEGKYTVTVTANSSNGTNVDSVSAKSNDIYSTKVTLAPKDAGSAIGLKDSLDKNTLVFTNTNDASEVLIAGEKVSYKFSLINSTGYTPNTYEVFKGEDINTDITVVDATSANHLDYTGNMTLADTSVETALTVKVGLSLTPATLEASISKDAGDIKYGYSAMAPGTRFEATVGVSDTDNVTTADYDYTYTWSYKVGISTTTIESNSPNNYCYLPTGLKVIKNGSYTMYCTIVATRKDNGEKIEVKNVSTTFLIYKAALSGSIELDGWTYGEARKTPVYEVTLGGVTLTSEQMAAEGISATVQYKSNDEADIEANWKTLLDASGKTIVKDVGEYNCRIKINGGDNYENVNVYPVTSKKIFEIVSTKYSAPTSVERADKSDKNKYGQIKWTVPAPGHIYEDTVNKEPMMFHVDGYVIRLRKAGETGNLEQSIFDELQSQNLVVNISNHSLSDYVMVPIWESGKNLSETDIASSAGGEVTDNGSYVDVKYDFAPYMTSPGVYCFEMFTYSDNAGDLTGETDHEKYSYDNVEHSDTTRMLVSEWVAISNSIDITDGDKDINTSHDDYEKVYDGKNVVLTVNKNNEDFTGCTYRWFKDGVAVGDGSFLSTEEHIIKDVAESGVYVCQFYDGVNYYDTMPRRVTINKRNVVMTSASDSKIYDSTALTNSTVTTNTGADVGFVDGEGADYNVTGSQTLYGTSDNLFTYTLKTGTLAGNYNISQKYGKLTVNKNENIVVTITEHSGEQTYSGKEYTLSGYDVSISNPSIYSVSDFDFNGTDVVKGTYKGTYPMNLVSTDFVNKNTNFDNVSFVIVDGVLKINAIATPVTITANSKEQIYNGLALTDSGYTFTPDVFVEGDHIVATVSGSITDAGTTNNTISSYKVVSSDGTVDVTSNYTFSDCVDGVLKVEPRKVLISSGSATKTYDGSALTNSDIAFGKPEGVLEGGLVTGEGFDVTITGSQTYKGSSANTFTVTPKTGTKAANYDISKSEGILTVNAITADINITVNSNSKVYDGDPLTDAGYTYTSGVLVEGDTLIAVVEGTITDVVDTPASNIMKSYKIMRGAVDVTDCYKEATSTSGTLSITRRPVTITSPTDSKTYDGTALTNTMVTSNQGTGVGFVKDEGANYTVTGSQTDVGSSVNTFTYTLKEGTKADNYTISKVEGTLTVLAIATPITITANSNSKVYDAQPLTDAGYTYTQGIVVSGDELLAVVEGSITDVSAVPAVNEVKSYKVMRNGVDVTANYTFNTPVNGALTIVPRPVTLTSATDSKIFDSTPLTNSTVTASTGVNEGFVGTQGVTFVVTGTQTDCGYSYNTFTYAAKEGTQISNYAITPVFGTLTVSAKGSVVVTITEHSDIVTYDGTEHSVTGYDVSISDPLYSVGDFTFNGGSKSTVKGTYKGIYPMNLMPSDFVNNNANFKDVTFNIIDGALTINAIATPITITANSNVKVYDGTPLTDNGETHTPGILLPGDSLEAVISGSVTNVSSSPVINTVQSYRVLRGGTDVTACYTFAEPVSGTLQIMPRPIVEDDLTLITDLGYPNVRYTGQTTGPQISVDVDLLSVGTRNTKLIEGANADYIITNSYADRKVVSAIKAGNYIVEVTGVGNYCGTVSKSYTILDLDKPLVTGSWNGIDLVNGGEYCSGFDITVSDDNLAHVRITYDEEAAQGITVVDEDINGLTSKVYPIVGSQQGRVYTIVATDISGNNNDTMVFKVYNGHEFTNYELDNNLEPAGCVYKAKCNHRCDVYDYILKIPGKVTWDYNYKYSTPHGIQEGTKNVGERETGAIVELYQGDTLIATKNVNCDDQCSASAINPVATGSVDYLLETFEPGDNTKDSGAVKIPYCDENGNHYSYRIVVKPARNDGGVYTPIGTYTVNYLSAPVRGGNAEITYTPGCFNVPWKVTLSDLPTVKDANGNTRVVHPSSIYVKVLYGESEDAQDSDYNIITQHAGADSMGVECEAVDAGDGSYTYSGFYPCWEYIGGTTRTYYHRIQVVGYLYDGVVIDISDQNYRSICDEDHINHTVTFDPQTNSSTGTILYNLSGILPALIFDANDGRKEAYATIWSGVDAFGLGGVILPSQIDEIKAPVRESNTFVGWYTERNGGTKVTGPVTLGKHSARVYAHWRAEEETRKPEDPDDDSGVVVWPQIIPTPTTNPNVRDHDEEKPVIKKPVLPVKDKEPQKDGNAQKGKPTGSIKVYTEHISDQNKDKIDGENIITANLPITDHVSRVVLTDKEWEIYNNGGSVLVRLTIDDLFKYNHVYESDSGLMKLLESLNAERLGNKYRYKNYIMLKLEKSINGKDWERIGFTNEEIDVIFNIPENYLKLSDEFILAKSDGLGGYVIMKDYDNDSQTITIKTGDFTSEYVLLAAEDEQLTVCYMHWFILLLALIYIIILIIASKKCSEDMDANEYEKAKRKSKINRTVSMIPLVIVFVVISAIGQCELEIPFDIVAILAVGIGQVTTYNYKYKK